MIGRTLGTYRIISQVGMGGMATVYKAYDPDMDRYVAVKVLPRHLSADAPFRERFKREAKAIAALEHIHILPVFTYGEDDGIAYMVMRYLETGTLTERIKQGRLPLGEAGRLLEQIGSALDYAHSKGILHRDVKPSNVLLDAQGNAYLTDFGLAKILESTADLTGSQILGTPAYMSPEQCQGAKTLTPATDIYSLGIILYEMVTGRQPFQAETPMAVIMKQLSDPLPPPSNLRPELPAAAERVIFKALAKQPESRQKTCQAMADAFAQAIASMPTIHAPVDDDPTRVDSRAHLPTEVRPAADTTVVERPAAPPRKRPGWVWGVAGVVAVLAVLAVAVIGFNWLGSREVEPLTQVDQSSESASPADQHAETDLTGPAIEAPAEALIAWGCDAGICLEDATGRRFEPIDVSDYGPFYGLTWSPDGRQLAFAAGEGNQRSYFYIVNWDGSNLRKVEGNFGNAVEPAWSPDGERLAMHSGGELAVVSPDGRDVEVLWAGGDTCVQAPAWSPDSEWIVVSIDRANCLEETPPVVREVWLIHRRGEVEPRPIAAFEHEDAGCYRPEVAFSGDGAQVAFVDDKCRAHFVDLKNPLGGPLPLDEFPIWWTSETFPQWGVRPVIDVPRHGLSCPEGQDVLFFDDFEGEPVDWFFTDENGRETDAAWAVETDGANRFLVGNSHAWATVGGEQVLSDISAHVQFQYGSEEDAFHMNLMGDQGRYYTEATLYVRKDEAATRAEIALAGWHLDQLADGQWHALTLSALGGEVEVYLDGEPLGAAGDPEPLALRQFGLENLTGVVRYDNVLVCIPAPS